MNIYNFECLECKKQTQDVTILKLSEQEIFYEILRQELIESEGCDVVYSGIFKKLLNRVLCNF